MILFDGRKHTASYSVQAFYNGSHYSPSINRRGLHCYYKYYLKNPRNRKVL
jgi:hypothetical protein